MCPIRTLFREETDTYSVVPIKQPQTDPLAWRALTPQMALLPSTGESTMKRSTSEWSYTGRAVIVVSIQVTFSEVDTKQMDPSNARSDLWCLCSMGQFSHCGSNYALFLFGGCTPTIGSPSTRLPSCCQPHRTAARQDPWQTMGTSGSAMHRCCQNSG